MYVHKDGGGAYFFYLLSKYAAVETKEYEELNIYNMIPQHDYVG